MSTWLKDYSTPADYTYDSNKILVSGGKASLRENLSNVYARWHMNESSGIVVPDDSGNARNGTTVNSPSWVAGKLGNAIRFNGLNQYIGCGSIGNFERTQPMSIAMWVKTSTANITVLMGKYDNVGPRGYKFYVIAGLPRFALVSSPTNYALAYVTAGVINNNIWHLLVVTYNGSSNANDILFYVDGVIQARTVYANTLSATILNSVNFQIAHNDCAGDIDEAVLFDRVLSPDEVTYLYNSGTGRENFYYYTDLPTIQPVSALTPVYTYSWDIFLQTLGAGNVGSIGYNLSDDNGVTWKYWNGSAWVAGGDSSHYNASTTVNTNISSFPTIPNSLLYRAFLVSDGTQAVELDENQVVYTTNQTPLVNAGSDASCYDHETDRPFLDASFSDPDGTITNAYYDIEGSGWIEILQGGYGSLLEAVQIFSYEFNNSGNIVCYLKVKDDMGAEASDSMTMTVQKYTVTFNVKNIMGQDLVNIMFNPGDGTGWHNEISPFNYGFDYNVAGYNCLIYQDDYILSTVNVPSTNHTENITLQVLAPWTLDEIAEAVWNKPIIDCDTPGTFGAKNQKVVPSEDVNDYKADVSLLALESTSLLIDGKVDTAITDIGTVDGKVDTAIADIGTVDGKVDTAIADIGTVDGKVDTTIADIGTVDGKVDTVIADIGMVDGKVDTAIADIGTVDGKVDTVIADIGAVEEIVKRVIGLSQENFYLDDLVYSEGKMVSCRVRTYSNAGSVGTTSDILATYNILTTYLGNDVETYKVVKV